MKTLNLSMIALAATLMMSGTASAASLISTNSTDVRVEITDGVASIYGSVDELIEKSLVEREIGGYDDVEKVKNYIMVSK